MSFQNATASNTMELPLALAIARHVPAFHAPGHEHFHAKHLTKALAKTPSSDLKKLSLSVHDYEIYAFLQFLTSDRGRRALPNAWQQLLQWLYTRVTGREVSGHAAAVDWALQRVGIFDVYAETSPPKALVLIAYRPQPLLPLSLGSARRAVTFVHGFIALVTANAYISTLGGGHFLCLHLREAKCMARLQIAIADALYDPVLKSKCRVNLAYNAMREGRFRRAERILQAEERVAKTLENDELVKIGIAARVYMAKTIKLHHDFLRQRAELTTKDRAVVDNFYRQRVVRHH